jgi:hypothetical protein
VIENRFRIHPEVEVYLTDLAFVEDDGRRFAAAIGAVWQMIPPDTRATLIASWRNACGPLIEYTADWPYRHWYDLASSSHGGHVLHFFAPALRVTPSLVTEAVIAHQLSRALQAVAGAHFPRSSGYGPEGLTYHDDRGESHAWNMVATWGIRRPPLEDWLRANRDFLASLRPEFPGSEPMVA